MSESCSNKYGSSDFLRFKWSRFNHEFEMVKASLTFKCMTEHLFADFSYSVPLDTYLWKQIMQMNRKLIHIWCNTDKKPLLFTKRKCHTFSWLFTAYRCSPRRRSKCTCRINSMKSICIHRSLVFTSWALVFSKMLPSWKTVFVKKRQVKVTFNSGCGFPRKNPFFENTKAQLVQTNGNKYFTGYSARANRSSSGRTTVCCK